MPGSIPGVLGAVAFAGIKFVGYSLAVSGLKEVEPAITASAAKIAAVRTGFGVLLGPLASIAIIYSVEFIIAHSSDPSSSANTGSEMPVFYGILFIVRIFVWALVLFLFTKKAPLPRSRFWLYALFGAVVSSLLDWPGYALAIAAPGKLVFC
jgi:hypothetical protein